MENTVSTDTSALSVGLLDSDEIEIKCNFERLIFHSDKDGYTVALYSSSDFDENGAVIGNFVAAGNFLSCNKDATVILRGTWGEHYNKRLRTYEPQFLVSSFDLAIPSNEETLIAYLTTLKGCGEATAKKIVSKYGDKTYEILESENAVELLVELPRVSRAKAETIVEAFVHENNVVARAVMTKCFSLGITPNKSQKLFERYGNDTINVLTSTPYRIVEIDGFGFSVADAIARSTVFRGDPFDVNSLVRIKAGVIFAMKNDLQNGNMYMSDDGLCNAATRVLSIKDERGNLTYVPSEPLVCEAIEDLISNSEIKRYVVESATGSASTNFNYLPFSLKAEKRIARFVCDRLKNRAKFYLTNDELKSIVVDAAEKLNFSPSEKQIYATMRSLKNDFSIITGGPGCGKTTIIKMVIKAFQKVWSANPDNNCGDSEPLVQLAAPTGRAARRMTESCGYPASTIHALLGLKPNESMSSTELKYIESDLLIVDEFSMVDEFVAAQLVANISHKTKVIFVGDAAQLPSVGPGSVFKELIKCKCVPMTELTDIFRQSNDAGLIVENASRVRAGNVELFSDRSSFLIVNVPEREAQDQLVKIYENELRCAGQGACDKVQVLTPRRTDVSTSVEVLNPLLKKTSQEILYPYCESETFTVGKTEFSVGDKVMQIKNSEDVANGDIGYITSISEQDGELIATINFGDRVLDYKKKNMEEIIHAYACTIHKSQGAEFDTIIIPILKEHGIMLERALFYTAITRAIKRVIVITSNGNTYIKRAIDEMKKIERGTLLSYLTCELVRATFLSAQQ